MAPTREERRVLREGVRWDRRGRVARQTQFPGFVIFDVYLSIHCFYFLIFEVRPAKQSFYANIVLFNVNSLPLSLLYMVDTNREVQRWRGWG